MKKVYSLSRGLLMTGLIVFGFNAFGQTGPAGIGNATGDNGQPQNVIWFDAARLNLSNNEHVEHLTDFSGNENHAEQSVVAARPQFLTGQLNGQPAISFDGSDDFMPFNGNVIASSDYTVLFVGKRRSNNNLRAMVGGTSSGTNTNLHIYWENSNQIRSHHYGNDLQTDMVAALEPFSGGREVNTYGVFATSLNSSLSSAQRKNFQNNHFLGSRENSAQLSSWEGAAFGRYGTDFHDVDVAEFIVYKSALTTAQMQIASQYLALKYGIAIDNDIFTAPVGYDANMAGIGKEADGIHLLASVSGLYIQENGSLDNGEYLFVSESDVINDSPVTSDLPSGVEERWKKDFSIRKVGSFNASVIFDLSEGIVNGHYPSDIDNYVLLYRAGTTGDYSVVSGALVEFGSNTQVKFDVADADLQEGYYTLGTTDQYASPVIGKDGVTWYTLVSGDWDDPQIWTLDPAGMLPNNPSNTYPKMATDNIVIRNGRTVTVQGNDLIGSRLTIDGSLDLGTTSGHVFNEIRGIGRVLMAADNFPAGDASHFSGRGKGEGTVQFYGDSYDITQSRRFFNVEIKLRSLGDNVTLLNDLTVEGYLKIDFGGVRINNDILTSVLDIDIQGNVYVEANGRITTGEGNTRGSYLIPGTMPATGEYHNIFHQFRVGGDFINRGSVRLTNLAAPVYNQFADNGAVTLRFYGEQNNAMQLYGTTDLYNLVVEKGVDRTYSLEVYGDDISYFKLFGPNNVGPVTSSPFTTENSEVRKALWIKSGTLKLTGQMHIPSLTEGAVDYSIGQNAGLWIAGSGVTVYSTASNRNQIPGYESTAAGVATGGSNQALSLYGAFRISDGFFGTRNSAGFIFRSESYAQVRIDGGTVNVSQFRSGGGGGGKTSYTQTGGTLVVRGNLTEPGEKSNAFAIFGFDTTDAVFNMSGGTIRLNDIGGGPVNGLFIPSAQGNYNVTGGNIIIDVPGNRVFEIASNADLWNLEISRYNASGTSTALLKQALKVGRDLIINENTILDAENTILDAPDYDLYVGRNFDLKSGGRYDAGENTTHFYSNQSGVVYARNNSVAAPLVFYNVMINKDQAADPTVFRSVALGNTGRTTDPAEVNNTNTAIDIQGNLKITRGEFNTFSYKVSHKGHIEIVDGRILASATNPGRIVLNGTAEQTIKGSLTQQQRFGSIELDNELGARMLSSISVSDVIMTKGIMNLDIFNMQVLGQIEGAGFGNTKNFKTAGNASDGGLSMYIDFSQGTADTETLLPVGTNNMYSPLVVTQSNSFNSQGFIRINPVNRYHPASTDQGKTIPYYWVVDTIGFVSLDHNALKYTFSYSGNRPGSANKLVQLWPEDFKWYEYSEGQINGNNFNYPYSAFVTGDYTVGNKSDFKDPQVYYSRIVSQNYNIGSMPQWTNGDTWSTVSHTGGAAGDWPRDGDIAIIGYGGTGGGAGGNRHHVAYRAANTISPARVLINSSPESGVWGSRLFIEAGATFNMGVVEGNGTIEIRLDASNVSNISGDFGRFVNNFDKGSQFLFHGSSGSLIELPSLYSILPNVRIEGGGNKSFYFPDETTILGNLIVDFDATLILDHELLVNGNFQLGNYNKGILVFPSEGERILTVNGDLRLTSHNNSALFVDNSTPNNLKHRLRLGGDIELIQGNTFNLFSDNTSGNNVILELFGDKEAEFTNNAGIAASLYRIVLNKMSNRNFTFRDGFSIGGPTDGDVKALELVSGALYLSDSGIDINLTSGGADFRIPSGTGLYLTSGATARAAGDNTGIWLDGTLSAGDNTSLLFNGGINNYIEYTSSGNSEIILQQATLEVGSQIRRSELAEEGILTFRQNHASSTLKIGTNAHLGGASNRGVFEMSTPGSYFFQTAGARMSIVNALPNSTLPSFYLNLADAEVSLGNGSIIAFGDVETAADQLFGLFSSVNLKDVHVDNQSGSNPNVNMEVVAAAMDNLTIDAGATLMANGLDLTIAGDWNNAGSYVSGLNTTTFTGVVDQNFSGNTNFNNLVKSGVSDFILNNANADIVVDNMFVFNGGKLHGNDNELLVKGDLSFNGQYLHSGTSKGIVMAGAETQRLTGNGILGMLTVSNSNGVDVPIGNQLTVNDRLRLEQGVLNIGQNLFVLGVDSEIEAGNPFSVNNMIQTNSSFTDDGVKKYIPSGAFSFVFPMGSFGKYTPVSLDISTNSNTNGSLLVKPAGEYHPSVLDPSNVLHYHWVLRSEGIASLNGTARMRYYPLDVKPDPSNISNYLVARLLSDSSGEWNKFPGGNVIDVLNNQLVFTFIDADDNSISGDYTAGLDEAIPAKVPTYISKQSGSWNEIATWDTYPEAGGVVPGGGPRGSMVIVAHNVDVPANFISSYRTTILENGNLELGLTFGHRLGEVLGNGRLTLNRGDLPAGVYTEFFSSTGGTLEFRGNSDYDILSDILQVNHLKVGGSGVRRLPNANLQLLGNLTIDGADLRNDYYEAFSVKGNIDFLAGSFYAGFGANAKMVFNGSQFQTVSGMQSFTAENKFHRLNVNNPDGVLFATNADVEEVLTLNSGRLVVNDGIAFSVLNPATDAIVNASPTRYIDGSLYKRINSGASFDFPLGNENRYGNIRVASVSASGMWRAQYYSSSPSGAGLSTVSKEAPVEYVSSNEYWNIEAPTEAAIDVTAEVTLRWDASSGVNPDETGLRGVQWLTNKWHQVLLSDVIGTSSAGTARTSSALNFKTNAGGNYITFGAITIPAYTWTGTTDTEWFIAGNWSTGVVPSASANTTIAAVTNLPVIKGSVVAQVNDLTISPGASLTLNPGGKLTVNGDLTVADEGGLIMKNTTEVNGLASLITHGDITGDARLDVSKKGEALIELTFPYDEWYYVSQPIKSPVSDIYGIWNDDDSFSTTEGWVNIHRANRWYRIAGGVAIADMEGLSNKYRPVENTDYVVSYNGKLNNGSVARSFTNQQYYLFGNPYPSAINWQDPKGWVRTNIGGTLWYRTRVNGGMTFVTYNRFADPGARAAIYPDGGAFGEEESLALIPPLQSAWISSMGDAYISIDNDARTHLNEGNFLKSSSSNSSNVVRIIAENASSRDGAVLYFSANAEEGFDQGDSEKMFNDPVEIPEVYTRIGTQALAINGLPEFGDASRVIPLSVRNRVPGEVTLRFDLRYYSGTHAPYLEDRETGAFINLLQEPTFTYTVGEIGDNHERFVLHFYYVTTDVEAPGVDETDAGSGISIKSIGGKVLVSVGMDLLKGGDGVVEIYTIEGRQLAKVPARSSRTLVILPNESGVYIIRAKFGSHVKSERVIGAMK